jgi:hypothetical protein
MREWLSHDHTVLIILTFVILSIVYNVVAAITKREK